MLVIDVTDHHNADGKLYMPSYPWGINFTAPNGAKSGTSAKTLKEAKDKAEGWCIVVGRTAIVFDRKSGNVKHTCGCDFGGVDCEDTNEIKARLEYLRGEIEAEQISYDEIAELQSLAEHIDDGDTVLLEWAGVPEN